MHLYTIFLVATENIFNLPDGVIHSASKEKSRGGKKPMIRPLQNNRNKICDLCCKQIIYIHFFRVDCGVWQIACEQFFYAWVQMNVVPRSTGNTNSGTRELTLKCKLKCYFKPMNNPLGVSPSKGKQGTTRGKEKIF